LGSLEKARKPVNDGAGVRRSTTPAQIISQRGESGNMKAEHVNPFLDATINLMRTTFKLEPSVGSPYVVDDLTSHRWEISGVMVSTGSAIGVVAVRLSRLLCVKLLEHSGLEAQSTKEQEALINGMVGELVNVIAGNAATRLQGYSINVSVPFVVQGRNHTIAWPERAPIIGIPFRTPHGPFAVYVSLMDNKDQAR
jgi:chemotaxis protein CheX